MIEKLLNISSVKTILYLSYLLHPKFPVYYFPTYMYYVFLSVNKKKFCFHVIPCPIKLIDHYLSTNLDLQLDESNCIVLSNAVNKNFLVNNSFNVVRLHLNNNTECFRLVHVVLIPKLDRNKMLISDILFYNCSKLRYANEMNVSSINQNDIHIASEVEICLINTQHQISNEVIDTLLKNYFTTVRILYKYDIVCVNVKKYAPEHAFSSRLLNIENLYFKCKKISSVHVEDSLSGYFCVRGETTVIQSCSVRGFLPASIFKLCLNLSSENVNPKYENCLLSKCPHGLEDYMKEIEKALQPFILNRNLKFKPLFLLQGNKGIGKTVIVEALASKLGLHLYKINCSNLQTNIPAQIESKLQVVFMKAKLTAPCLLILDNFEVFGKNSEGNYDSRIIHFFHTELEILFNDNNYPIILLCLSNKKNISSDLSRQFLEIFNIDVPDQQQRTKLLRWIMRSKNLRSEVNLDEIGALSHGFLFGDLYALIYHSMKNFYLEMDDLDICLRQKDILHALDLMQKSYSSTIGAPKIPNVLWTDIGGLEDIKKEILRTIDLPLKHPNLFKVTGLKRSGILLYGPPGTGKTLIAKAVATECGLCFLSVKGPELLNKYIGQSEKNVRQVFERAREASPCIVFFDELDSLAPNRGSVGDSAGVMDRIVAQFLTEMDSLNDYKTVFIIGATNRPDLLDPSLLRPGRFDKLLHVGPCVTKKSKLGVLEALTRKFNLSSDVNFEKIVSLCPPLITGADLYSVCASAWFSTIQRIIQAITNGKISMDNLSLNLVIVEMNDFLNGLKTLKSSISSQNVKEFQFKKVNKSNLKDSTSANKKMKKKIR